MTPSAWASHRTVTIVLGLPEGSALSSKWPPIVAAVRAYGQLRDDDERRRNALTDVRNAITAWRANQNSMWTIVRMKDLVRRKVAALADLELLMDAEARELTASAPSSGLSLDGRPQSSAPKSMAVGVSSAIAIGSGAAARRRVVGPRDLSRSMRQSFDARSGVALPTSVSPEKKRAFNTRVHVHVHFTQEAYVPGIFQSGIIPGAQQGIGLPNDRDDRPKEVDAKNFYVLSGSAPLTSGIVRGEAGGEPIVVVSSQGPTSPDMNYKFDQKGHIGAYYYTGSAPPVRDAAGGSGTTYSFPWPIGPRSKTGLAAFLSRMMSTTVTADEAAALVSEALDEKFGPL